MSSHVRLSLCIHYFHARVNATDSLWSPVDMSGHYAHTGVPADSRLGMVGERTKVSRLDERFASVRTYLY